jgi:hypothetical protein
MLHVLKLFVNSVSQRNHQALLKVHIWPNMAVKWTRWTQTLLSGGGLFGFVGFALAYHPVPTLLLR